MKEATNTENCNAEGGRMQALVKRFGCTGTHGGINKMCDHCANNIENYPETEEGWKEWQAATKIDEVVCRLPQGPDGKYWTQYIALHHDA